MSGVGQIYDATVQQRVARVVATIEAKTSAEIVVAVRPRSGHYRHTDYLMGAVLAFVSLATFLFHPLPMRTDVYIAEFVAAFVLGSVLSARIPALRRTLTSRRLLTENVARAARAAFVELGVSRTRARTGVLVYVSLFERRIQVVPDISVDSSRFGKPWQGAVARFGDVFDHASPVDQLEAALSALGDVLATTLPRAADDIDELPNAMSV